ncbi:Protease inhibitor protein [Cucumis melo var. makuwa]|uniref:Protease inhibitor protein n=1 Tax=Cucumis melo var. makuwa TaxID=1194695 RepID=A0A5A7U228_CUCMM|nr:Protease inhibitor protein [Cucumis melo var. makuwa]TYK17270.1 Protease inhibitor protein [Cucumis melo var. makuwa]
MAEDQSAPRKTQWPELVFIKYSIAAAIIERENPDVEAVKILSGTPRILNFDTKRVWCDVNVEDVIVKMPKVDDSLLYEEGWLCSQVPVGNVRFVKRYLDERLQLVVGVKPSTGLAKLSVRQACYLGSMPQGACM